MNFRGEQEGLEPKEKLRPRAGPLTFLSEKDLPKLLRSLPWWPAEKGHTGQRAHCVLGRCHGTAVWNLVPGVASAVPMTPTCSEGRTPSPKGEGERWL